ncbi:MAG: hypothetical protein ACQCN3_08190 [Candidatus Bathyarchaeia archaeon]
MLLVIVFSVMQLNVSLANSAGTSNVTAICIKADGSVEPSTAPIQYTGNMYSLTDDIQNCNITIQRNNIIFNGSGFSLQGPRNANYIVAAISLACSNVTIFNFHIFDWTVGVLGIFDNNTVQSNAFSNNNYDVAVYASDYKIIGNKLGSERIVGNNITIAQNQIILDDYDTGFWITNCTALKIESNNITFSKLTTFFISTQNSKFQVYHNNFLNIEELTMGTLLYPKSINNIPWDNGVEGNYWSDYEKRYPQAVEINNSGIGNFTYVSEAAPKIIDNYPLIKPYNYNLPAPPDISEFNWLIVPIFFVIMLTFAVFLKKLKIKTAIKQAVT